MVFKEMPTIRIGPLLLNFSGTDGGHAPNFVPLRTIVPYLLGHKGFIIAGVNLAGNIVLLIPIGFLVPFLYSKMTWKRSLILAVASGFIIELMQVALGVGIFDIDDIILNALGVMIGYWTYAILTKWVRSKSYKKIIIAAVIFIVSTAGVLYVIYPKEDQFVNTRSNAAGIQTNRIDNPAKEISPGDDPCKGTGGTGQIVNVNDSTITVKRNDGIIQTFKFTDQTTIRSSSGVVSKSELKAGDRVTLVIDESETASVILICNG